MASNNKSVRQEWQQYKLSDVYDLTSKPSGIAIGKQSSIPFISMSDIPQGGGLEYGFELKSPSDIASGTYFERGDLLLSKITPCFENGKQCVVNDLPNPFGMTSTEIYPIKAKKGISTAYYLFFLLLDPSVRASIEEKMEGSTGRKRVPKDVIEGLKIHLPPVDEQEKISGILLKIQHQIKYEESLVQSGTELLRSAISSLVALNPESNSFPAEGNYKLTKLEDLCAIKNSSMSYGELLEASKDQKTSSSISVMGIKVSDMNFKGNEVYLKEASLERELSGPKILDRTIPPGSIVFPKRGAAIATNKKRITTKHSVLDPNVIALVPNEKINNKFLYYWFLNFDLKDITEPGPTPQLNKKNLAPLLIPVPDLDMQMKATSILASIDDKVSIHRKKVDALRELFGSISKEMLSNKLCLDEISLEALGGTNG